jgi:hypothetical protein
MADAKRFILHSSEMRQGEQSFSHPWNPKSQLIGVQLSRALGLERTAVRSPACRRVRNLLSTTPITMKRSGSISYQGVVSARLTVKSSKSVLAISWPSPRLRCRIIKKPF